MNPWRLVAGVLIAVWAFVPPVWGSPVSTVVRQLLKYAGKEVSSEAAELLVKKVGAELAERTLARALSEGGEALAERLVQSALKHGDDVLRAVDNLSSVRGVKSVLDDLDQLPVEQIPQAAARLATGPAGRELAETVSRHGPKALIAEVAHPGIGGRLVRVLGDDGAHLAGRMTTNQAITVARHLDDLEKLPDGPRRGVLELLNKQLDKFTAFIGRFVEKNPGKTLFTLATTTVLLAESERLFGGCDIAYDKDGNPRVVCEEGFFERMWKHTVDVMREPLSILAWGGVAAIGLVVLYLIWRWLPRHPRARPGS